MNHRSFRYLADPLFLAACAAYVINRWWLKTHLPGLFFRSYFNDLLLIPCALPPVLLVQRWFRLRRHDEPPLLGEIVFHLGVWSVLFEWIGPHLMARATGDALDVVAYLAGGLVAGLWWQRRQWESRCVRL